MTVIRKFEIKTYLVCQVFETHPGGVEGSGLLGISDPETNVVESVEDSDCGLKKRH